MCCMTDGGDRFTEQSQEMAAPIPQPAASAARKIGKLGSYYENGQRRAGTFGTDGCIATGYIFELGGPNLHSSCVTLPPPAFSSSGQPKRITSKIGSLTNANYKPGGGNVKILDEKVDFSYAQSKCNSKANLKHKPCGGDVQIVDNKLHFKENGRSRINSLANAKHVPGGGNVKIESRKLEFKESATSRIGSLQNASYKAGGGNVKIFNEKLPWLKYNKPNLPPEEIAKINKHTPLAPSTSQEPIYSSRHSSTAS
ncbi:hypothetical protein ACTXT7_013567 [Hymenolepis weldensis]